MACVIYNTVTYEFYQHSSYHVMTYNVMIHIKLSKIREKKFVLSYAISQQLKLLTYKFLCSQFMLKLVRLKKG